jgi:hypothetical protein
MWYLLLAALLIASCAQQPAVLNSSNSTNDSGAAILCGGPDAINCSAGSVCQYEGIYPGARGSCVPANESPAQIGLSNGTMRDDAQLYSCARDDDCVRQSSCCDCGEGTWVNKRYYDNSSCTGTPQCKCPLQARYPLCQNWRCTSRSAR